MANSSLVNIEIQAYKGNYTSNRAANGGRISMVTVHHVAGVTNVKVVGAGWQKVGRNASSHYGIKDNEVAQYVAESDIAWTNSNWNANKNAVTIEVCNSSGAPNWEVSEASLNKTIHLVADIAKRNGLYPLVVGKTLTYHSMYTNTNCPGPYLLSRMAYIAQSANNIISGGQIDTAVTVPADAVLFNGKATNLNGKKLNVRTGAGTNYSLLAGYPQLAEDNQFEVLAQTGSWYKIRIARQHVGYVSSAFVVEDNNTSQQTTQSTGFPFVAFATNLGNAHLNVRTGAGAGYPLISEYPKLAQNNQFDVLSEQNGWYQIKIAGKHIGWVSKQYVQKS